MNSNTLETLAENGTEQDVIDLLKAKGASEFMGGLFGDDVVGTGVDYIAAGVNNDNSSERNAKLRAVKNFLTKQGEFAEPQELPPSLTDQFQAAVAAIKELQEQVKEIPVLKAQIAKLQKKPAVKKAAVRPK